MMDQAELDILRGRDAQHLIEHPLLQEAFDTLRTEWLSQWENSPERDVEGRERLRLMVKTLPLVRQHLLAMIETGTIAQAEVEKSNLAQRVGQKLRAVF